MRPHKVLLAAVFGVILGSQSPAFAGDGTEIHIAQADFNKDGVVDLDDITFVVDQPNSDELMDLNGDGVVDSCDKELFYGMLGETWCLGDYNLDGMVNTADLLIFLGSWLTFDPIVDLTGDGFVSSFDYVTFFTYYGSGC